MLTRSGWLVAGGSVAAGTTGWLLGTLELFVFAAMGLALVTVAVVWVRRTLPHVEGARRVQPNRPMVGRSASVELSLHPQDGRGLPVLTVVDPVAGTVGARMIVGPTSTTTPVEVGYRLPTRRRGRVEVGPLCLERTDPFGLAVHRVQVADRATVTVLPSVSESGAVALGGGHDDPLDGASQRALAAVAADDLATLRPYVVGDDLRRVHWPSSAHADTLLVRRDEERWQGQTTVLLDCRAHSLQAHEFEQAVSAAAGVIHALATAGNRVRLITTAGLDTTMLDARRSEGVLLEQLAVVAQHPGDAQPIPPPHHPRHDALVILGGRHGAALVSAGDQRGYAGAVLRSFVGNTSAATTNRPPPRGPVDP